MATLTHKDVRDGSTVIVKGNFGNGKAEQVVIEDVAGNPLVFE